MLIWMIIGYLSAISAGFVIGYALYDLSEDDNTNY